MTDRPAEVLDYATPGHARPRPPRPPVVRIVVLGLLMFPVIIFAGYPIAASLQAGSKTVAITDVIINVAADRANEFGFRPAFHIVADGAGRGASVPMTRAYVTSTHRFNKFDRFYMLADLRNMTFLVKAGGEPTPVTQQTIRAELERVGFATASVKTADVAASIEAELLDLAAGRLPASEAPREAETPPAYRRSYMLGNYWPRRLVWWPWYTPWCIPVWLAAWVLLALWFLRRHRRRLEQLSIGSTT